MANLLAFALARTRLRNAGFCGRAALAAAGRNREAAVDFFDTTPNAGGLFALACWSDELSNMP